MKVQGETVMANVRAAVSEQRAAALALDPGRLTAANERLDKALTEARHTEIDPAALRAVVEQLGRELKISGEVMERGAAAGDRGARAVSEPAVVYAESGAPVGTSASPKKPIAAA